MLRHNPTAINRGRNYYNCGGFEHITRHCRNWRRINERRRIKYRDNLNNVNNLKEKESLVVLD